MVTALKRRFEVARRHNKNAMVLKCRHFLLKLGIEVGVPYGVILTPGALLRFSLESWLGVERLGFP